NAGRRKPEFTPIVGRDPEAVISRPRSNQETADLLPVVVPPALGRAEGFEVGRLSGRCGELRLPGEIADKIPSDSRPDFTLQRHGCGRSPWIRQMTSVEDSPGERGPLPRH